MMIAIKHVESGEAQFVASLDGYGPGWTQLGPALPSGDVQGLVLVDDVWVRDLAPARAALAAAVDAEAEACRQRFLTPGAGQALTYQRKEAEARAWLEDHSTATPFLSAEATARGMTIAVLAAEVVALADTWTAVGSAIEGRRMGAKAAIAGAGTLDAIMTAAKVDWEAVGG